MRVELADGSWIQARGGEAGIISYDDHIPADWALYLDKQWGNRDVPWPKRLITWPDGRPCPDEAELFEAILEAWHRVESGQTVEIACDGGTGRTGAVVACLAILAGTPEDESLFWVREHYHRYAPEIHEELPIRFAAWLKELSNPSSTSAAPS